MAVPILNFLYFILDGLFGLLLLVLLVYAVLSWLIAFNILNTRNPGIYRLLDMLGRIVDPILEPFRRLIPPIGGFDISYILAWLVIEGVRGILLPAAFKNLALLFS